MIRIHKATDYLVISVVSLYFISNFIGSSYYLIFGFTLISLLLSSWISRNEYKNRNILTVYLLSFSLIVFQVILAELIYIRIDVPHSTLAYIASFVFSMLLYMAGVRLSTLLIGIVVGGFLNSSMILIEMAQNGWGVLRTVGGKSEVNSVALLQSLSFVSVYMLFRMRKVTGIITTSMLAIFAISVFMTGSRSGVISLISVFSIVFILEKDKYFKLNTLVKVVLVGIPVLYFFGDTILGLIQANVQYLLNRFFDPNSGDTASLMSRWDEALLAIEFINENPIVILTGTFPGYTDNFFWSQIVEYIRIHNTYVAMIVENGMLSILLLLFFPVYAIKHKLKFYFLLLIPIILSSMAIYSLYLMPVFVIITSSVLKYDDI